MQKSQEKLKDEYWLNMIDDKRWLINKVLKMSYSGCEGKDYYIHVRFKWTKVGEDEMLWYFTNPAAASISKCFG